MAKRFVRNKIKNDSFDGLEEVIIRIKESQNLSVNTVNNYKVTISVMRIFFKSKDAFKLTNSDAENFIIYLLNDHEYYLNRFEKKKKNRSIRFWR